MDERWGMVVARYDPEKTRSRQSGAEIRHISCAKKRIVATSSAMRLKARSISTSEQHIARLARNRCPESVSSSETRAATHCDRSAWLIKRSKPALAVRWLGPTRDGSRTDRAFPEGRVQVAQARDDRGIGRVQLGIFVS